MGTFVELSTEEIRELMQKYLDKRAEKSELLRNVATLALNTNLNEFIPTQLFAFNGNFKGEDAFIVAKQDKGKYFNSFTWTLCPPEAKYIKEEVFDAFELIVDWNIHSCFTCVQNHISDSIGKLCQKHGFLGEWGPLSVFRITDQQLSKNIELNDPTLAITDLDAKGVQELVKHWEYARESSYEEVLYSASLVGSAGLTVNNELAAWGYGALDGAIHGLYTAEGHRGKGYGKIVLQALGQSFAKKGIRAITEVDPHNVASKKLMMNSGFEFSYTTQWMEFSPKIVHSDGHNEPAVPFKHVSLFQKI